MTSLPSIVLMAGREDRGLLSYPVQTKTPSVLHDSTAHKKPIREQDAHTGTHFFPRMIVYWMDTTQRTFPFNHVLY